MCVVATCMSARVYRPSPNLGWLLSKGALCASCALARPHTLNEIIADESALNSALNYCYECYHA